MSLPAPLAEYQQRLELRRGEARVAARRVVGIANARVLLFLAALPAIWGILVSSQSGFWILLAFVPYLAAVLLHDRARRQELHARRASEFYARGLARLENRWTGTGRSHERFVPAEHPYARHLDLFGSGSLFELLSGAQTAEGEERLARWLLEPAEPAEIRARQAAVDELRSRLDLREDLAALGPEVRSGLRADALVAWGEAPLVLDPRHLRWLAHGLVALTLVGLSLWIWTSFGPLLFVAGAVLEGALGLVLRGRVRTVIASVEEPARELRLLSALLERLEREGFESERGRALRARLESDGVTPARRIRGLRRVLDLLDSRRNQLFAPISPLLLWATHAALAIEAWRARSGRELRAWIEATGELEALLDLASYAYEHPDDPFPELLDGPARFAAESLGHPFLDARVCVRNDVALGPERRLLLITGSNMSGKSTFLRTVGINVVLAQAGAPVRARSLRLTSLSPGASIQSADSLQEGHSRFYTEIRTLKRIISLTEGARPVLYLLDELLQGTNSHDRQAGARALVRGLLERDTLGLVTTHDLALAEIAVELAPRAANVHFEDELRDGQLHFDYHLRSGVVQRSNALELMRAVGLEV